MIVPPALCKCILVVCSTPYFLDLYVVFWLIFQYYILHKCMPWLDGETCNASVTLVHLTVMLKPLILLPCSLFILSPYSRRYTHSINNAILIKELQCLIKQFIFVPFNTIHAHVSWLCTQCFCSLIFSFRIVIKSFRRIHCYLIYY